MISIFVFISCFLALHEATLITIDNTKSRLDVNGNIMDAHDGSITSFTINGETKYWMHSMQYGLCVEPSPFGCSQTNQCGFQNDHNISIWSSKDLSSGSWVYEGNAIDVKDRPEGIVYRPHLIYNPNTELYVLYWNYNSNTSTKGLLAVATSSLPSGPFSLINERVNITQKASGDFDLFSDDDGMGYIVYSMNFVMHIEQLTPDYIYSAGVVGPDFEEYFVEAPVMFKRNDIYYVLFGYCCCFCQQGSGVMVHTASHPLGPYTKQFGDRACTVNYNSSVVIPGTHEFTPSQGCQYAYSNLTSVVQSQQNVIIEVNTPNGIEYIWTGDRWQQAPDGIKGHEPQYWVPLDFNSDGSINDLTWQDSFTINIQ